MWTEEDTVVLLDDIGQPAEEPSTEACSQQTSTGDARTIVSAAAEAAATPADSGAAAAVAPPGHCCGGSLVLVASLVAACGGLLFGYDIGVISGAMLQLRRELQLSCVAREAVVGGMMAGALLASAVGGWIIDGAGRRATIILNGLLFVIGSVCLASAQTLPVLLMGRVIVGFAAALSAVSECIYISEMAPASRRGMLVGLNEAAITVGFLLAFLVGHLLLTVPSGWRYMFGLAAAPALLQTIAMFFLPETPHFLLLRRRDTQAETVLQRLTGKRNVRQRLALVRLSVEEQRDARCSQLCSTQHNMADRMAIGLGLVLFQQVTGQPNVLSYAPTLLQMVGFCGEQAASAASVGLGVVKVVSTISALLLVDRAGRRTFLLAGSILMAVCLVGLAAAARGHHQPPADAVCSHNDTLAATPADSSSCGGRQTAANADWRRYVALASLMGYVAAYAFGFGPMTWLVLSEIYPSAIRGRAVAAASSLNWLSNLLISATFLQAIEMLTISGVFLGHAVLCLLSAMFVFFVVPETRGQSLHQISEQLSKRSMDARARSHLRRLLCISKRSPPAETYQLVTRGGVGGDAAVPPAS